MFLARCQKDREELEFAKVSVLDSMRVFVLARNTLNDSRQKQKEHEIQMFGGVGTV